MLDRRHFLSRTTTALAATLALRGNLRAQLDKTPPLPDHALHDKKEDSYWAELRQQFLIPEDEIYHNNGTVGSSPAPVLRAIFVRIRGGDPNKLRLSTPYYLQKKDIDRFLEKLDEYKHEKKLL